MYPILYENITAGTVPAHNGLGILSDCISCEVEQERNGIYELVMVYPMTGIHAKDLINRRVLKVKPNFTDNPQLFRIDRIGKEMNGKFTVFAKHISYDLLGYEITSGSANNAAAACALLANAAQGYSITTDKVVSGAFKIDAPASVKSYFLGRTGSFLDVYGTAELKYDNFNVQFLLHAGQDRGVTIRYGKNLLELSQEIDASNLYTHVRCYYKQGEDVAIYGNSVATGLELDVPNTLIVDVSGEYQQAPTTSQLTTRAQKYINDNNLTTPTNNITLDFVQSEELANRVDLCDTVSVYYEALGITRTSVKCIRTKWDCIKEKYIETEFGDAVTNAIDTMVANNAKISEAPSLSFMEVAIAHATELITGNLGGYVVLNDSNGDGEPDEILVMDKPDINTATNVWRFNQNGLGHSTSYAGQYALALTKDGQIVATKITTGTLDCSKITVEHLSASSIDTGTLNANLIKAGTISDTQGNSSINMTNGAATMTNFKAKNGFYLVDSNGITRNYLSYNNVGGTSFIQYNQDGTMNAVISSATGDGGQLRLYNPAGTQVANVGRNASNGGVLTLARDNGTEGASLSVGNSGGFFAIKNSGGTTVATMQYGNNNDGSFTIKNSSGGNTIYGNGQTGGLTCVTLYQTSSRKVKDNIKPIDDAEKILELKAVSFDYKDKGLGSNKRGFIAEEVEEVLPNLVTPETEETPACLDYIGMIPYLQAVIKMQEERIKVLEKRLDDLEKQKQ